MVYIKIFSGLRDNLKRINGVRMVWSRRVGLSQICLQNTAIECFRYNNDGDITLVVITETFELYLLTMLKQPLGMTSILVLLPHWSSVSHGPCFYFFQNFYIFTSIFNQHFYETRSNPNKLFVYLKDDWMFSQHWATCWWHRYSVG